MAWIRIDDNAPFHRKQLASGPAACWLWVCGLGYCQRLGTDGFIPEAALPSLGVGNHKRLVAVLVSAKLWHRVEGGYQVHKFLEWNESADERKAKTASSRRQMDLYRDKELRAAIQERDGDRCHYCGVSVIWADKRGPHGATYDHKDPNGGNSLENVVVACRSCNSSKRGQHPWRATLKQVGSKSEVNSDVDQSGELAASSICSTPQPLPQPTPEPEPEPTTYRASSSPPALIVSPLRFEQAKKSFAFFGDRLKVPHVLHQEFVSKLGRYAEKLPEWYQDINDELADSGDPIPDVFAYLRPRFNALAVTLSSDSEMGKFLRGEV